MGTPAYARIIADGLFQIPSMELRVVTKPDAPVGRKRIMTPSAVAQWAVEAGLAVDRPKRLKDYEASWREFAPDIIVTASYGKILPPWLLRLAPNDPINVHASLLPRWRGPNPIAWSIYSGDRETGITIMKMDQGIDTGAILLQDSLVIAEDDTVETLTDKLAQRGKNLLVDHWSELLDGRVSPVSQDEGQATYAPKFSIEHARIDWGRSAEDVSRMIRSMSPDPGAYTSAMDMRIKILKARSRKGELPVGVAQIEGNMWEIGCGVGVLQVKTIQPAGKKPMTPGDFMRGIRTNQAVMLS